MSHEWNSCHEAISCSSTVSACEKCGQWQMVLCLLAEMRLAAAVPDEITYNSAISAFANRTRIPSFLGRGKLYKHRSGLFLIFWNQSFASRLAAA